MEQGIDPGLLDAILLAVTSLLNAGQAALSPQAEWLARMLATAYLLVMMSFGMAGMLDVLPRIVIGLAKAVALIWTVLHLQVLTSALVNTTVAVGLLLGGNQLTVNQFLSPGTVFMQGSTLIGQLVAYAQNLSWVDRAMSTFSINLAMLAVRGTSVSFFAMAAHVTMLTIAFLLVSVYALILIPFAILSQTAWVAETQIKALVTIAIRLGMCAMLTSATNPIIQRLVFAPDATITMWSALSATLGAALLALVSILVPHIAVAHGGTLIGLALGGVFGALSAARRVVAR